MYVTERSEKTPGRVDSGRVVTEPLNHKSNTNDVGQTAHLFYRFIVVVCIAVKSISQYQFVF